MISFHNATRRGVMRYSIALLLFICCACSDDGAIVPGEDGSSTNMNSRNSSDGGSAFNNASHSNSTRIENSLPSQDNMSSMSEDSDEFTSRYDWDHVTDVVYNFVAETRYPHVATDVEEYNISMCRFAPSADVIAIIELSEDSKLNFSCEGNNFSYHHHKFKAFPVHSILNDIEKEEIDIVSMSAENGLPDHSIGKRALVKGGTFLAGLIQYEDVWVLNAMIEIKPFGEDLEVSPFPDQDDFVRATYNLPPSLDDLKKSAEKHRRENHKSCGDPIFADASKALYLETITAADVSECSHY